MDVHSFQYDGAGSSKPQEAGMLTLDPSFPSFMRTYSRSHVTVAHQSSSRQPTPGPGGFQSSAQTNLLGLLKFGTSTASPQQASQQQSPAPPRPGYGSSPSQHSVHGTGISASDLVASLRGGSGKPSSPGPREKAAVSHVLTLCFRFWVI